MKLRGSSGSHSGTVEVVQVDPAVMATGWPVAPECGAGG
jgi:hypothetical protein